MGLSPSKIALLARLNNQAQLEHDAAKDLATKKGRPAPPAPALLTDNDIEFPKWVGKGWKASGKRQGHQEPTESQLAGSKEELDILLTQGWSVKPETQSKAETPSIKPTKAEASSVKPETKPETKFTK